MSKFGNLLKALSDKDVHSEMGLAAVYSVPAAALFADTLLGNTEAFNYLSGGSENTWPDIYVHSGVSAALTGYVSKITEKYVPRISKYSKIVGTGVTLGLFMPAWESYEQYTALSYDADYLKDIISNTLGVASYLGWGKLREKVEKLKK